MIRLLHPNARTISCDMPGCMREVSLRAGSAEDARSEASKTGWGHGVAKQFDRSIDICPKHVEQTQQDEEEPKDADQT